MTGLDYLVVGIYAIGLLVVGFIFTNKMKNSSDMFAAGNQSPWWVAGLSGYMTMFSAATFVVWGGISYRIGLIGISIQVCTAIGVLLAGIFLAARWRRFGVATPAEYFELRFGKAAFRFYTVVNVLAKIVSTAVGLYSLGILVSTLTPLPEWMPFRSEVTGHLSHEWAILICGLIVVIYTVAGGLWAVLMNDVLQFLVLTLAVVFVVPLLWVQVGSWSNLMAALPDGFLSPVTQEYTWVFLIAWIGIQFTSVGGEWAFVQRFLCVPTAKDATKGALLFGLLYVVSPWVWMAPPILYRAINPNADPEEAYFRACMSALPVGMLGLILVAMFSATASSLSAQLNVFSGVLTHDIYNRIFRPKASDAHLVFMGRVITLGLGAVIIAGAFGVTGRGAEHVAVNVAALLISPLMLPTIWGMFSRRIGASAVAWSVIAGFSCSALISFGFAKGGWFDGASALQSLTAWIQAHYQGVEKSASILVPLLVLGVLELKGSGVTANSGWERLHQHWHRPQEGVAPIASDLPIKIVIWSLIVLAVMVGGLAFFNRGQWHVLVTFALLLAVTAVLTWLGRRLLV